MGEPGGVSRPPERHGPWLLLAILGVGALIAAGGFITWADQHSGTPGRATVDACTGGRKYQPGIRCTGRWEVGGRAIAGRVENAGYGDVGKTVGVRVHGTDHATKPGIGTPIVLWALGTPIVALALAGLRSWWRARPAATGAGLPRDP